MQEQFDNSVKLYSLRDKNTGICSMYMTSRSDKACIDSYISYINDIFKSLKKEKERVQFLKAVHGSDIVRICKIDEVNASTENDFQLLVDLNGLEVNTEKKEKNVNGESK